MNYFQKKIHTEICEELIKSSPPYTDIFAKYHITNSDHQSDFIECVKKIKSAQRKDLNDISNRFSSRKTNKKYFHIPNPLRGLVIFSTLFCCLPILFLLVISCCFYEKYFDISALPFLTAVTSLLTIVVGVVGWSTSAWISHRNSKIQHAISLVGARFSNAQFLEHSRVCRDIFENREVSYKEYKEKENGNDDEKKEVQSIKYMLNYFEFVSVGVISGEIDIGIVKKTLRGNMRYYIEKCDNIIKDNQLKNPSVWRNFTNLYEVIR